MRTRRISFFLVVFALLLFVFPVCVFAESEIGLEVESIEFELGAILNITIKENYRSMAGYYFGVIPDQPTADNYDWYEHTDPILRITKFPGTYYLWLRDTKGEMYGPTKVEMPDYYYCYFERENTEHPPAALSEYLPTIGYSVDELNAHVAEHVAKAGIYTREGVVVGTMSYLSKLQELGLRVPYFRYGYWAVRDYGWYTNPDWGTIYDGKKDVKILTGEKDAEHEAGTHCNGFLHYVFRLSALNVRNYGDMGKTGNIGGLKHHGDNWVNPYHGRSGDILQSCTEHEMLIIDKYDDNMDGWSDGYIIAESSKDTGGQVYAKKPYDTYSRFCNVYDMDGVFYNTGSQARMLKYWQNYHIPAEDWPQFLLDAVEEHTAYHLYFIDDEGVQTVRVPFRSTVEMPEIRGKLAALQQWDTDLTGVAIERDYVIHAELVDTTATRGSAFWQAAAERLLRPQG